MSNELKPLWDNDRIIGLASDTCQRAERALWEKEANVVDALRTMRADYEAELATERAKVASMEKQLNQTIESNDALRSEFVRATIAKSQAEAELATLRAELPDATVWGQACDDVAAELKRDWLAMLKAIAQVSDAVDSDEWGQADDATLQEQFDPWQALRDIKRALATLRSERDQWQQHAEGAVYALMLTEPHMLAGNLTEWIANCAQMIEAQGRRLAELEAIKAAPQWREVTYKDIYTPLAKPKRTDYADLCERWSEFNREPLRTEDGHEYAICRRITQEGDDAA